MIDELKIDRSVIAGMESGPEQLAVVRSIVKLGETLHLETVAEGIEDLAQLESLRELEASHGQGYFFSAAVDANGIAEVIAGMPARQLKTRAGRTAHQRVTVARSGRTADGERISAA